MQEAETFHLAKSAARMLATEWVVSFVVMVGLISVGVLYGMKHPIHGCDKTTVPIFSTALHNFLLDALLMSGVFTMGIGSIVACVIVLSLTGAEMGAVVSALGGRGVMLLLPHGLFEITSWYLSIVIGLSPLTHPLQVRFQFTDSEPEQSSRFGWLRLRIGAVILLVSIGAVVEHYWTKGYGGSLVC